MITAVSASNTRDFPKNRPLNLNFFAPHNSYLVVDFSWDSWSELRDLRPWFLIIFWSPWPTPLIYDNALSHSTTLTATHLCSRSKNQSFSNYSQKMDKWINSQEASFTQVSLSRLEPVPYIRYDAETDFSPTPNFGFYFGSLSPFSTVSKVLERMVWRGWVKTVLSVSWASVKCFLGLWSDLGQFNQAVS